MNVLPRADGHPIEAVYLAHKPIKGLVAEIIVNCGDLTRRHDDPVVREESAIANPITFPLFPVGIFGDTIAVNREQFLFAVVIMLNPYFIG